jgi:HD-like signal output (HDOD) protein
LALIYIDDLTEGMLLASDLYTPRGRFVLAAGAELQAQHLQLLKSWGVIEADIADQSLDDEYLQQQVIGDEFVDCAEGYLLRRFLLNDIAQEPLATLYRHATHLFAQRLQKGLDPMLFREAELEGLVGGEMPSTLSLPQLLKGNVEVFSLPSVYYRGLEVIEKPEASSAQIADVISKDAGLTVRLLRLVNSPMYGFGGKIDSVSRAVSLLGTNDLSSLALGVTLVRQFQNIPSQLLDMNSFWRHSIRCALFARIMAEHLRLGSVESYFTGGLLHDIGRLVMVDRMPSQYAVAIQHARSEHLPMYRAEQSCLQLDHSIVGKTLAGRWRLPVTLSRMIGGHHSPRLANYSQESCVLHLADIFAHTCGSEALLVNEVPELQLKAWVDLGLDLALIAPIIHQVEAEFSQIVNAFFAESEV